MEIKKRFKLYKSGKNWCMAALMFAGTSVGMIMHNSVAQADDANAQTAENKTENVTTSNNDTQTKEVVLNQDTTVDENNSEITSDSTVADSKTTLESQTSKDDQSKNGEVSENGANYYYDHGQMKTNYFRTDDQGKVFYYGADGKMYQDKFYQNWG
ncbi:MAG: KxYKxGKxW signal peptide domain-containing protein, partial [Limosilactobacillus sp.]|nr:KxYKxGKxW signal peptide domain-containing protein [Limosilactobacillus sp.]